jgi:nucleotide-binding universal stress UspA family protein
VRSVGERFWPAGSKVLLFTSIGSAPSGSVRDPLDEVVSPEIMQNSIDQTEHLHQQLKEELQKTGLNVSSLIKQHDPKQALLVEAEQWGADTIFVGSRGLSRFKRFLLGSVSSTIVARAHCSVEVVRSGE